tara:strand:- start:173 stop:352 length:180 start_codon:yes stop_codon:yes gene_type:complete
VTKIDKQKVIDLLDQIIEKAKQEDLEHKKRMLGEHSCQKTVGESWMVYHLNILKQLLNE